MCALAEKIFVFFSTHARNVCHFAAFFIIYSARAEATEYLRWIRLLPFSGAQTREKCVHDAVGECRTAKLIAVRLLEEDKSSKMLRLKNT